MNNVAQRFVYTVPSNPSFGSPSQASVLFVLQKQVHYWIRNDLKGTLSRRHSKRQMPSNIQLNLITEILLSKTEMQDYKDGSGLKFIKFNFVTGSQEIKIAILVEFWLFYPLFCIFSKHFFAFIPQSKLLAIIMKTRYFSRETVTFISCTSTV